MQSPNDLRRATVVFVDVLGASRLTAVVGIERAYAIVTGGLRVLEGIARRHGGVVDKFLSDAMMAVFGHPLRIAEPERAAVAAALAMQEGAARWMRDVGSPVPLVLRIGINTGLMIAGDLRGPLVREFAVLGDAVNVAARLKDVGEPGAIHVGGDTWAATRDAFQFAPLSSLTLRGKLAKVSAYRVLGPDPGAAPPPPAAPVAEGPLVGRDAELASLRAAMAAVAGGQGGAVVICGEAGAGKTRLVAELAADARARGLAVVADAAAARGTDGPVLAVVEDVHDGDDTAHDAIAAAVRDTADRPILWLLTARGAPPAPLAALPTYALGPLDPVAADRLLELVSASALAPAARARIVARAAGNPGRLVLGALVAPAVETELALERATVERSAEAERRRVTVLFADISGFTSLSEQLAPAEAYRIVHGCLRELHEAAEEQGGTVDKHLGDCVMAVFGAPIAVEDAPRAAVNAAIAMRHRVRAYNARTAPPVPLDVHVGINSGLGIAGDVSGALLREFALMGDAVSVASKLKDVAPRTQVWVGATTARATRAHFAYRCVTPRPEGFDDDVWELASDRQQVHRPRIGTGATIFPRLVGRARELGALHAAVTRVAAGTGGAAAIVGEAGLGKSRLLAELHATPEAARVQWAEGRSVAMGRTLRFHPFVDLVRSLLGLGERAEDGWDALVRVATEPLGADAAETLPFLGNLLGMALPAAEAARIAEVPGDALDRLHLRAVRVLLLALARRRPLVLVFEDVYWADRSSVELLGTLLRLANEAPVLFVWATRPGFPHVNDHLTAAARGALAPSARVEVVLAPLEVAGVRELLAALFPPGALPAAARERIEKHAGGNPLYVEELLRSLIEQGLVVAEPAGLRATGDVGELVVPPTVQEVILSRVDRLTPRRKQALQLAAVVGQRVAASVLADLIPDTPARADALAHLVEHQLLVEDVHGDETRYAFKHRLILEATYGSILETRRAELHAAVARVVEARLAGTPGFHGMLAYHFGLAGDVERAEEQLFLAGDDAARAGAPAEALELFAESSRLYLARHPGGGDPEKRCRLHQRLADAHFHRGQLEEANRHFNAALRLLGERVPDGRAALAAGLARALAAVLVDLYVRGGGRARRPPASPRDRAAIRLMFDRARAQTVADPARFLFDSLETLRKLRGVDPATVPGAGGMYAGAIGISSYSGLSFDMGQRFLRLAARYVDAEDVAETFLFRMMRFAHHFLAGDWSDAWEIPDALVEQAVRVGQLWDVATHTGLESFKLLAQGRFAEAEGHVARLGRIEEAYVYELARSNRHAALAFLETERRRLDAAAAAVETYRREHAEPLLNLLALGTQAKVHVLRGDLDAARSALAVASGLLAQGTVPPFQVSAVVRSRVQLAVAEWERGGRPALRPLLREALHAAARVAWLRPEIWRLVGEACCLAGRGRRGLRWLGRALAEAERLGMRPEAARVRAALAQRLDEAGQPRFGPYEADGLRTEARQTFNALGLAWDLARLDEPGSRAAAVAS